MDEQNNLLSTKDRLILSADIWYTNFDRYFYRYFGVLVYSTVCIKFILIMQERPDFI